MGEKWEFEQFSQSLKEVVLSEGGFREMQWQMGSQVCEPPLGVCLPLGQCHSLDGP